MESLMEEKFKVDKLDLSLQRKPRPLISYTNDFLTLHFGLQTLAKKQLKAMLVSLEELYNVKHPYGVFFCKLLEIFHPRPIPTNLSVFLIAVQHMFNIIAMKNNKNFASNYEVLQYGGHSSVIDVMELVMKICKKNRPAGERIISNLHKENDNKIDISFMKVCGTMAKTGKDPKSYFELLDINNTNNIDYQEFVDGVRYTVGIWITQEEAEDICCFIDKDARGIISLSE